MSGEDVIVSIGVDTSGADVALGQSAADFDAWSREAQRALDSTAKAAAKAAVETERAAVKASASAKKAADGLKKQFAALDRDHITLGAPIDAAAEKMARLRAESEKLERVSSLLGPQLGGVVQIMSKLGKVGGSGVGGATAAVAGVGVAFAAALYAGVQFGSMVVSTIDNVEELSGSLSDLQRRELAGTIAGMREAAQAGDDLDASLTELQIRIAGGFADDVSDLRYAMTGIVDVFNGLSFATDSAAGKLASFYANTVETLLGLKPLLYIFDKLEQYGGKVRAQYDANRPSMLPEGPYAAGQAPGEQPAVPPFLSPAAGMYPAVQAFKGKKPATGGGGSRGGGSDPLSGFTLDGSGAAFTYGSAADALAATDFTAANSTDAAIQARKEYGFYLDQQIKQTKELAESTNILSDAEYDAAITARDARKETQQQTLNTSMQFASSLVGLFNQIASAEVASTKEGTAAHRQAMRDQLTMQEASAFANAALGITNIWAQWAGQPIVAAAMTLVEGAATGIAIGQIEAQRSKLHTGGLAPDELWGMPNVITRRNERAAVLTAEGQRHITADDIDRANSGASTRGDTLQIVVRDESGRRMSGRQFARPIPTVGQATRGVR